jgi:dipeptidyl aminopeptidase/acylaminoacyl peptidase
MHVDAHHYEAEGYGFFKRDNRIDSLCRTVDWFDKYLKAASTPAQDAGRQ